MALERIAIVGASLAGLRTAEALRRGGFTGAVELVGDEPHHPYDRPPLSKQRLAGSWDDAQVALRQDEGLEVTWHLGAPATGLRLGPPHTVELAGGGALDADAVVLATGAAPRHLPGTAGVAGVHTLRNLEDAHALHAALTTASADAGPARLCVIGAGFIGGEVASTAAALGCRVTLVEALPRPLERQLGPTVAAAVSGLHALAGIDTRFGVGFEGLDVAGDPPAVTAVRLADGAVVPADVVVVGVGVAPTTGWLATSGLDLPDGVACDDHLRALAGGRAVPGVYAAGDLCRWANPQFPDDPPARVEHWTNAVEQAAHVAAVVLADAGLGEDPGPFAPVPYFWSDQHGAKLQHVGRCRPDDEVLVVEGALDEERFVAVYGRDGRTVAAFSRNRPAKIIGWRNRIAAGEPFPPNPS